VRYETITISDGQGTFTVRTADGLFDTAIFGYQDRALGAPAELESGRYPQRAGEAVASAADGPDGFALGDTVTVQPGGLEIEIVGTATDVRLNAGPTLFADQRTYVHNGDDVDRQVHLGFDLASTTNAPVLAANSGRVVHAGWLGIYGNCVILDHGMGLQSLDAHLSSISVGEGDEVGMNGQLGLSGETGLAGGDHLHFTMLLAGHAVTPIDWWSQQWVDDRIMRKLRQAAPGQPAPAAQAGQ